MRIHRCVFVLGTAVLALLGTGPLQAAVPSLLTDIGEPGVDTGTEGSVEGRFLSLGKVALFAAEEPSSGREVWVSDGTEAGTGPLLDACPGPCSSTVDLLGAVDGAGVFLLRRELADSELWRSDGTRPGTRLLARSRTGGPERCQSTEVAAAAVAGPRVFFSGRSHGEEGCGLWTTDGTEAGTRRLREITLSFVDPRLHEMTPLGSQVFFSAVDAEGAGLWRSDGTPEGTVRLHLWTSFRKPRSLVVAGSLLFFVAEDEGLDLWASDGTEAGTRRITNLAPADPGFLLQESGGTLTFVAEDGTSGREVWTSDGTAAGTRPITGFANANPFADSWRVEKLGGLRVFPANDGLTGSRLWSTAGRPESTVPLDRCEAGCPTLAKDFEMVRVGAKVFFPAVSASGCQLPDEKPPAADLWMTDGTGAGTRRVRAFCACCRVARLTALLGKVFFAAGLESPFDNALWASDGTAAGTRRLIGVGGEVSGVLPVPPVVLGGRGLFAPLSYNVDPDLWVSDGTPQGTEGVASIRRNGWSSSPHALVPTPAGVRFLVSFGSDRLWDTQGTSETTVPIDGGWQDALAALGPLTLGWGIDGLWRVDGTPGGSLRLTPESEDVVQLEIAGSRAVFLLREAAGINLWASDGTAAGTRRIATLPNEAATLSSAGSWALLSFHTSRRVWRTDGTTAGTREIPLPAGIRTFGNATGASLGNVTFFRASSGFGAEIWRTDGTAAGTWPVTGAETAALGEMATHGGALFFLAGTPENPSRLALWRSTGAPGGTQRLRTFGAFGGFSSPAPAELTSLGSLLFFRLDDGESGSELWRTDGTAAGTVQVHDIAPGEDGSFPMELTALGSRLYFAAREAEHGIELWETDGTAEGTRLVQDIAPGAFSSNPQELTAGGGGRLFFTADDGLHGREPWVYSPEGASCVPAATVLCLSAGRFKVEVDWRTGLRDGGRGHATALTPDTGTFWFFDAANVEVIVKVLDGRSLNGHHWVFFGALSNVEYAVTVTDTLTGAARRYTNLPGRLGSVADTQAFGPLGASLAGVVTEGPAPEVGEVPLVASRSVHATGSCTPGPARLCLNGGRFAVEARWKDFQGHTGAGKAVPLSGGDTGYFWFFDAGNVEVVLKVLDGRPLNGKFWVFYGALSNVEYTLTVTDTQTGTVKTYSNPKGRLASVADTGAF